jgi:hypothetical protein
MTVVSDAQHINLVDGHVHIYDCFDLPRFLEAAYNNFKEQARLCCGGDGFIGVLLLSERTSENYFQALTRYAASNRSITSAGGKQWFVQATGEPCSLLVANESGKQLVLIAGRQLVTREKIEVLALITEQVFSDGISITALIDEIKRSGAIAVIPWGVGKWIGGRGGLVGSLLTEENRGKLFLGDNGGRPSFWPSPAHFAKAGQLGIHILPGTDPLPLKTEGDRCGSYGFAVRGLLSQDYPGRDLGCLLGKDSVLIESYGELESPGRFIRNQLLLRLA